MRTRRARTAAVLALTATAMIAATLLWRSWLLQGRTFDPDEMQHLHAAWCVSQGLVPYRDFFEHHAPGLALLLAPLVGAFDTAGSFDAVLLTMLAARGLMLAVAALGVGLTWKLADLAVGRQAAWIAAALLSVSIVFVARTLEVRPDVPALSCWVASLVALGAGTRDGSSRVAGRRWLLAGVLLGLATVFTQKLLLAGPGLAVASTIHVAAGRSARERRTAAGHVAAMFGGFLLPLAATGLYFSARGAFWPLVDSTLFVNLGWHLEVTPRTTLRWLATRDPWLCAFAAPGLLLGGFIGWRGRRARPLRLFLACAALSLVAGLFVIPAPFPQYALLFLPLVAVLGGGFLWRSLLWLQVLANGRRWRAFSPRNALVMGAAWAAAGLVSLGTAAPFFRHPLVYPALGVAALGAVGILLRRRLPHVAAAVVLAGTSVYQGQQATWMSGLSNREQVHAMRVVHAATGAGDTVLDGFSGYGWFRPHAWFYFFVHPGVRHALSGGEIAAMVRDLDRGVLCPKAIVLDGHVRRLSPDVEAVVLRDYAPTEAASVFVRRGGC